MRACSRAAGTLRALRALLGKLAQRCSNYLLDHGGGYSRDMVLVREALIAVGDTKPPRVEVQRLDGEVPGEVRAIRRARRA